MALTRFLAVLVTAGLGAGDASAQIDRSPLQPSVHVGAVAVLTDGVPLIGRSDGHIVTIDPETGATVRHFARHASGVTRLAIDPRGEFVAAASADGDVALWPVRTRAGTGQEGYPGAFADSTTVIRPTPEVWTGEVQVEWTHDGSHLVTWSYNWLHGKSPTTVQVWGREGELVWTGPHARQVSVHPTLNRIAVVIADEVLLGWPGEDLRTIELDGAYDAVEFSPDGKQLAVGGSDFRLWVLDGESGATQQCKRVTDVGPYQLHEYIMRVRWSPHGHWLGVMAGKGCNPAIFAASDLSTAWAGGLLGGRMWTMFDIVWTPDGRMLTGFGNITAVDPETSETQDLVHGAEFRELVAIAGTDDVLLLADGELRRIDPATARETWRRRERANGAAAKSADDPLYGALRHVQLLGVSEDSPPVLRFATAYRTQESGPSDGRIAVFERPAESAKKLGKPTAVLDLPFNVLPYSTLSTRVRWRLVELDKGIVAVAFDESEDRVVVLRFPVGRPVATLENVHAFEDARFRAGKVEILVRAANAIDHIALDVETLDVVRASLMGEVDSHSAASFVGTDCDEPTLDEAVVVSFRGGTPLVRRIDLASGKVSRIPLDVERPSPGAMRVAAWGRGSLRRIAVGMPWFTGATSRVCIVADDEDGLHELLHTVYPHGGIEAHGGDDLEYGQAVAFTRDLDGDRIADLAVGSSDGPISEHLDIVSTRTGKSWSRHADPKSSYRIGSSVSVSPCGRFVLTAGGHVSVPEDFRQKGEALLIDTTRRGWRMSAFLSPGEAW